MTASDRRRSLLLLLAIGLLNALGAKSAPGSRELSVKPQGDTFSKPMKSSIVFTCELMVGDQSETASGSGPKWYHESSEITDKITSRVYVEDDSATVRKLYITEITKEDEGNYHCIANVDGTEMKKSFSLSLFKDIEFVYAPEIQHPAANTDAVIQCQVSGQPVPQLSWRHNGVRVSMGGRYEIVKDGLRIQNITLQDDGNYTCRAEVELAGRYNEQKILVEVHIPPEITEGPGTSEGVEGDDLSVSCKAEGLPPPEFQYYKDGSAKPLVTTDRVKIDAKTGTLVFSPLKKEDEGVYTCAAHNDVGNRSLDGKIVVYVRPSIHEFQDISMKEGETPSIICSSYGDPPPNMTIQKVGSTEIFGSDDNKDARIVLSTSDPRQASLTIKSLILEDSGDYVCKVESKFGYDEKQAKLTVTYRPRFAEDHPKSVYIWAGKKRNITCDVQAEPVPTMSWLKGGKNITDNGTFHVFTEGRKSSLQVEVMESDQTWIYGKYSCQATNEWGTEEIHIELIRATFPDSPHSVNVSERSPTSISLVVEPPVNDGGEKVNGYRVEYFEKLIETNVSIAGDDVDQGAEYKQIQRPVEVQDTNKIQIENLKPNTTYIFKVKAKNEVGVGSPRELTATTEAVRRPNPVKITSRREADAFTYTITWEKPITGGLPIKEYEIKYREVREDDSGEQKFGVWNKIVKIDGSPTVTHKLDGLWPRTIYQLQVRALNEEGWSDVNTEFQFHTREATPSEVDSVQAASVGPGAIVGIVVVIFIVLLVIVDVSCYFVNNCGVTMCICVHLCGKSATFAKEKAMEEGESKEVLKQPIETYQSEEGASDVAGEPPVPAYTESEQCLKTEDDKKENEKVTEALKEGMDGQKEEMDSSEVGGDIGSDMDKSEKAPIV